MFAAIGETESSAAKYKTKAPAKAAAPAAVSAAEGLSFAPAKTRAASPHSPAKAKAKATVSSGGTRAVSKRKTGSAAQQSTAAKAAQCARPLALPSGAKVIPTHFSNLRYRHPASGGGYSQPSFPRKRESIRGRGQRRIFRRPQFIGKSKARIDSRFRGNDGGGGSDGLTPPPSLMGG